MKATKIILAVTAAFTLVCTAILIVQSFKNSTNMDWTMPISIMTVVTSSYAAIAEKEKALKAEGR